MGGGGGVGFSGSAIFFPGLRRKNLCFQPFFSDLVFSLFDFFLV